MKTSDFLPQFARDRQLREARTNKTASSSVNTPTTTADKDTDAASDFPLGYTRTRGVRLHIKVTNTELPDSQGASYVAPTSGEDDSAKRERLLDKNAGPVLALMSVPVDKGNPQG
jgi:hypothetical protein